MPLSIAIFSSGRGSNFKAIQAAIDAGQLDAQVSCLVCNIPEAPVIDLAQQASIPVVCIPHHNLTREAHEAQILKALAGYTVDYVVLAGYMRLLTPAFFQHFLGTTHYRVVNIHPSLLPAFPGAQAYEDAFYYGVKISGVTVHFVNEEMDQGPIILQESFPRLPGDSLQDFKERGLTVEHQLYPKALQIIASQGFEVHTTAPGHRSVVEVKTHVTC